MYPQFISIYFKSRINISTNKSVTFWRRGHIVPSRPKILPCKILLLPTICPRNVNGTLAFEKTNHLSHSVFWWNRNQHVNMIPHEVTFHHPTLLLCGQLSEHLSQVFPEFAI